MMRLARLFAVTALAATLLAGCDNGDLPPATQFSPISGTVLNAITHAPLAGALVVIDSVLSATTDSNGRFTIARAPSGILDYSVQAPGYAPLSQSASAPPGKALALSIWLNPAGATPSPSPVPSP